MCPTRSPRRAGAGAAGQAGPLGPSSGAAEGVLRRRLLTATPRGTYTEWWWPPSPTIFRTIPAGYQSFEHVVRVEVDPGPESAYVWAHEFTLVEGHGGFVALQAHPGGTGEPAGKAAVFSIRGGMVAEGPGAEATTAAGAASCRIPFSWEAGQAYQLRVWNDRPGWWAAAVAGGESGRESFVGRILVPEAWRRLGSWSMTRTEYEGRPLSRCDDLPPCRVSYSVPTADDGSVEPERHESRVGPGTCDGSRVETVPDGVRHEMGGTA